MAFIDDMRTQLVDEGISDAIIYETAKAKIPKTDGPFLSLVETGGMSAVERHDKVGTPYQRPTLQVVARAQQASEARTLIRQVYAALVAVRNTEINSTFYLWVKPSEPFDMGLDEVGRQRFALNISDVMKAYS